MDTKIEELFNEIPEFDQENAVEILKRNCEKIADELLTISSTTLNEEEESMYEKANDDLMHTRYKEVEMAEQEYKQWEEDKSEKNWESFKQIYQRAHHHIKINLANFI